MSDVIDKERLANEDDSPSEQQVIEVRRAAEAGREPGDAFDAAYAKQCGVPDDESDAVNSAVENAALAAIEALDAGHDTERKH